MWDTVFLMVSYNRIETSKVGILKDKDLRKILSGEAVPDKRKLMDGEGLYILLKPLSSGKMGMY